MDGRNSSQMSSDNKDQIDQSKSVEDNSFESSNSDSDDLDEDIPFNYLH